MHITGKTVSIIYPITSSAKGSYLMMTEQQIVIIGGYEGDRPRGRKGGTNPRSSGSRRLKNESKT